MATRERLPRGIFELGTGNGARIDPEGIVNEAGSTCSEDEGFRLRGKPGLSVE